MAWSRFNQASGLAGAQLVPRPRRLSPNPDGWGQDVHIPATPETSATPAAGFVKGVRLPLRTRARLQDRQVVRPVLQRHRRCGSLPEKPRSAATLSSGDRRRRPGEDRRVFISSRPIPDSAVATRARLRICRARGDGVCARPPTHAPPGDRAVHWSRTTARNHSLRLVRNPYFPRVVTGSAAGRLSGRDRLPRSEAPPTGQ